MEDYKQKYNEAFEKAKEFYDNEECRVGMTPVDLETIFPELKDTKDERIRKELIQYLTDYPTLPNGRYSKNDFFDWLKKQSKSSVKWNKNTGENKPAVNHSILMKTTHGISEGEWKGECWYQYRWATCIKDSEVLFWIELSDLDKQCEQKTINKYEHKFDIGDWITCPEFPPTPSTVAKVVYIVDDQYDLEYLDGTKEVSAIDKVDSTYYRWTIKDAKDGDVLACKNGWACIFKRLNDNIFSSHCFMDSEGWFCENGGQAHVLDNSINCHPATKEQRELLFTKLKESGHEWDADKKEIKNIL